MENQPQECKAISKFDRLLYGIKRLEDCIDKLTVTVSAIEIGIQNDSKQANNYDVCDNKQFKSVRDLMVNGEDKIDSLAERIADLNFRIFSALLE